MTRLYVCPAGPRPDYRLVLTFVWGDAADCDTDGNSRNPASQDWTQLYAQNRALPTEVFHVRPRSAGLLVLEVSSEHEWLAAAVAFLLAATTRGTILDEPSGSVRPPDSVLTRVGDFDVAAAWARYQSSVFQLATLDEPYPNLKR